MTIILPIAWGESIGGSHGVLTRFWGITTSRNVPAILKGSAATVAAEGLQAIALAMERAGNIGQLDRCEDLLPRAVEEFERFKRALERTGWA